LSKPTNAGTIAWTDLTVPDAESLRKFYSRVVAWRSAPLSMGEYSDFNMIPLGGEEPVVGICHARGVNADLPPV
jgi:predicted enzyme related to lactoylglutathione lyase